MATANDAMVMSSKHKDTFKVISLQKFPILTHQRFCLADISHMVSYCQSNGAVWENSGAFSLAPGPISYQNREEPDFGLSDKRRKMENSYCRIIKIGLN